MEQEDKELLIKEIGARLPYGVKVWTRFKDKKVPLNIFSINTRGWIGFWETDSQLDYLYVTDCRLYLRSMSSMTEKEREEYNKLHEELKEGKIRDSKFSDYNKWLYSHHFDYNDLIEKGLAIEAPKGMYWYL